MNIILKFLRRWILTGWHIDIMNIIATNIFNGYIEFSNLLVVIFPLQINLANLATVDMIVLNHKLTFVEFVFYLDQVIILDSFEV